MRSIRLPIVALSLALTLTAFCVASRADTLVFKDGTRIEGDVKKTDDGGYNVILPDGRVTHVEASKVEGIEIGKSTARNAPAVAADRLGSLRRSVEPLTDLKQIIDRYRAFIENNKGTPAAKDAEADLATWQDRLNRGLVKVAGKWVTPEERTQLAGKANDFTEQGRLLLKQARIKEAEAPLQTALDYDPQNAAALYLMGVSLFQQEKLVPARKQFEAVQQIMPEHPATLNNLAVIVWRQR